MANKNHEENTKTRIVKAATKLFAEQGYQKATIAEISNLA